MDNTQFDELAARLAARLNRRSGLGLLAGASLPLVGLVAATDAKKKKKITLCVNGKTVQAPKKKAKKLLQQGATKGACRNTTKPPANCQSGQKPCGNGCIPQGDCCLNTDCSSGSECSNGQCVATTAPPQCAGGFCAVFVTSDSFTGALGNLDGADAKCQAAADAANLDGTFKAWLSVGSQTPANRFVPGTGPWRLLPNVVDGDNLPPVVATNFTGPITCGATCLQHAIDRDENGEIVSFNVWTATFSDGSVSSDSCAGWTTDSSLKSGLIGESTAKDEFWTGSKTQSLTFTCNIPQHLYCFEQAQ